MRASRSIAGMTDTRSYIYLSRPVNYCCIEKNTPVRHSFQEMEWYLPTAATAILVLVGQYSVEYFRGLTNSFSFFFFALCPRFICNTCGPLEAFQFLVPDKKLSISHCHQRFQSSDRHHPRHLTTRRIKQFASFWRGDYATAWDSWIIIGCFSLWGSRRRRRK